MSAELSRLPSTTAASTAVLSRRTPRASAPAAPMSASPAATSSSTAGMVRALLRRRGVGPEARDAPSLTAERRSPAEVTLWELAERLAMPEQTVYRWLRRGELRARRALVGRRPIGLVTADADEIERLRALRAAGPPGRGSGSRAFIPSDS